MTFKASIPKISRSLGLGKDKRFVLSSTCLAIVSFFYFFVLGSALQITVYTFEYRVSYEAIFNIQIINLNVDTIVLLSATIAWLYLSIKTSYKKIALMIVYSSILTLILFNFIPTANIGVVSTLPLIVCLIFVDRNQKYKVLVTDLRLSVTYLLIEAIGLASCGIISLFLYLVTGAQQATIERYPYGIYQQLLSLITPTIMAALVFCVPLKIILSSVISKFKLARETFPIEISGDKFSTKRVAACLSICIVIGIGLAFIPHIPTTNPRGERLGVDSPDYVHSFELIKNQTASTAQLVFKDISSGDRPLTLLVLLLITDATQGDPFQIVEYSPLILTPLLILGSFFLARQLTANDKISLLTALLSAISFQTVIGIYSGFYANWFALILGYFAFVLLIRCLRRLSKSHIAALAILLTAVLLAHTHTWIVIISIGFVFLLVLQILDYYPRKRILVLYLVLSSSIAVDVLKASMLGSSTGLGLDASIALKHGLGITQFTDRVRTLADTVQIYYGGAYANIAILGLASYWLVYSKPRDLVNIFMLIFMSAALIPLFIGDFVLQSRVLFDIPFQIPGAISLVRIGKKDSKMLVVAILLIAGYLSFHILANLGYIPPSPPVYGFQ